MIFLSLIESDSVDGNPPWYKGRSRHFKEDRETVLYKEELFPIFVLLILLLMQSRAILKRCVSLGCHIVSSRTGPYSPIMRTNRPHSIVLFLFLIIIK